MSNNVLWRITDYFGEIGFTTPTVTEIWMWVDIDKVKEEGRIDDYSIRQFLIDGGSYMSEIFDVFGETLIRRDVVLKNRG